MELLVNKPAYRKNKDDEALFRDLSAEVRAYIRGAKSTPKYSLLIKFCMYVGVLAGAYAGILTANSVLVVLVSYVVVGVVLVLLGLNFAHDFAHNAIFKSKKLNNALFESLFMLMGANGYLWKKRHTHSHHNYPNTEGYDVDLELGSIIHLSKTEAPRHKHRYQHLYAPFLYLIYTLYWVFYKDFALFFKPSHANLHFKKHRPIEWFKFFAFKILYIIILIIIPWVFSGFGWAVILPAFFVMHFVSAGFLLFTFLITHHVENTQYYHTENNTLSSASWMMQQLGSSNDFHPFSPIANFIFGGFNCHAAHHLFPDVCHIHYPQISRLIHKKLVSKGITINCTTWVGGVASHLRLLKKMGKGAV